MKSTALEYVTDVGNSANQYFGKMWIVILITLEFFCSIKSYMEAAKVSNLIRKGLLKTE